MIPEVSFERSYAGIRIVSGASVRIAFVNPLVLDSVIFCLYTDFTGDDCIELLLPGVGFFLLTARFELE